MTLLATVLLVALIAFVLNTGWQISHRTAAQDAADATVIGGAGWVARSFNTVAADNVGISRYLALVNTIDALPLVTSNALNEQTLALNAVNRELPLNLGIGPLNTVANAQFTILQQELNEEVGLLTNNNAALQAANVSSLTQYSSGGTGGAGGKGQFWQAMQSLDELSQGTLASLATASQSAASSSGQSDLPANSAALLVPTAPQVPWLRGAFADFQRPVTVGQLPTAVDDKQFNRGPYDAIYGWRDPHGHFVQTGPPISVPGTTGVSLGGISDPFGGTPSNNGSSTPQGYTVYDGYTTYGTQEWTLRQFRNFAYGGRPNLDRSPFYPWLRRVSDTKMNYCWNALGQQFFAQPVWDAGYPQDVPNPVGQPMPFSQTLFLRLGIKSRYPAGSGQFMGDPSTWYFAENPPQGGTSFAQVVPENGWWLPQVPGSNPPQWMTDPAQLANQSTLQVAKIGKLAWVYELTYTVFADPRIGITEQFDANGNPIPQSAYFVQVVIFGGVNRNLVPPGVVAAPQSANDVPITNPYAGFDPSASDAPAPIDFDHTKVTMASSARLQYLTFLGVTRSPNTPPLLPNASAPKVASGFGTFLTTDQPYPNQVTMAQAKVFNDHSWDLWTQMWHAQLEPIQNYGGWVQTLQQSDPSTLTPTNFSTQDVADLSKFLQSLTTVAPVTLSH